MQYVNCLFIVFLLKFEIVKLLRSKLELEPADVSCVQKVRIIDPDLMQASGSKYVQGM